MGMRDKYNQEAIIRNTLQIPLEVETCPFTGLPVQLQLPT